MNNKLQQYNDIVRQIRMLESTLDELRPQVLGHLEKQGLDTLQTAFGTFTVMQSVKYIFSERVKQYEVELKTLKDNEKEEGIAQREESRVLRFTPKA
jgi:H2-forming N5,N10-methylenetetrahydromethanopterin dehydrogenase-like enzyme